MSSDALAAEVALALVPGIGRTKREVLLGRFGGAEAVLQASLGELTCVPGVGPALAQAIKESRIEAGFRVIADLEQLGATVLLLGDERYPRLLTEIPDPPPLLFALGRLELLKESAVAIVGSRSHTRYGAEVCRHFAGGLARHGLVVVSGMARGLDAVAHSAALEAGGGTIGVLAHGFGVIYPSCNRALYQRLAREGCLLTENPPGQKPHQGSFPRRNRLISGLAPVTLVVEAGDKSGALITAGTALVQGRELLAVPGPITSPTSAGCNRLIQQGAKPALGLRDVLEEYGKSLTGVPSARLPRDLGETERRVMELLGEANSHVDDLAATLGLTVGETLAALTSLEIQGLVTQEGKVFRRQHGTEFLYQEARG